jgi:hypothetical protein
VRRAKIVLAIAAGEHQSSVTARLECDEVTVWRTCQRYRRGGLAALFADGRRGHSGCPQRISPVQQAQIVELACLEPIAKGLHITHWSSEDLARQAVTDKIAPELGTRATRCRPLKGRENSGQMARATVEMPSADGRRRVVSEWNAGPGGASTATGHAARWIAPLRAG